MKLLAIVFTLIGFPALASDCKSVEGIFSSVSESHWFYDLNITKDRAVLTYEYSEYMEVTDKEEYYVEISKGYCYRVTDSLYKLVFSNREIELKYNPIQSHASFGEQTSSPGFIATLNKKKNIYVELWSFK